MGMLVVCRVATIREKLRENNFFPGQAKIREFVDGQGNLKSTRKSGNLKINGYCSLQKLYLFYSRGQNVLSS